MFMKYRILLTLGILLGSFGSFGPQAAAQTLVKPPEQYQSPRHFFLEFRLGPYEPSIDHEFSEGNGVWSQFGSAGKDVMFNWELDLQLFHAFGSLAVAGVIGYYSNTFPAMVEDKGVVTGEESGSDTGITLLPLGLLGVYRFDWPMIQWGVPLVPFVKFGVNYNLWWLEIDGETSTWKGKEGKGGTWGWQFNAGAAFLLDVLDKTAAKTMDEEIGINHTYLFFEFAHVQADGFGSDKALNVGDTTWQAGIAFEF
jgi:hypothetical protein